MLRIMRLAKLLKLIRLLKVSDFVDNMQDYFPVNKNLFQVVSLTIITMYIAHVIASVWFAVGIVASHQINTSWVEVDGLVVDEVKTQDYGKAYIASLYWAMTTLSTVGHITVTAWR